MQTNWWLHLVRRCSSLLIALCFVLPLSQCDSVVEEDGKAVTKEYSFVGAGFTNGALTDIGSDCAAMQRLKRLSTERAATGDLGLALSLLPVR